MRTNLRKEGIMANSGFVGFFDILGYQNIIENNAIEETSRLISNVLVKIPVQVKETIMGFCNHDKEMRIDLDSISVRVISDSIILAVKVNEQDSSSAFCSSNAFIWFSQTLGELMFKSGLPIRGVVDFGDFFLLDHCFAGIPLVNSYRLCGKLEIAGAVLTNLARKKMSHYLEDQLHYFGDDFLVPLKDNQNEKHFVLDTWLINELDKTDVRQLVFEAFHAHNKDVPSSVLQKIQNTEMVIRHMHMWNKKKDL